MERKFVYPNGKMMPTKCTLAHQKIKMQMDEQKANSDGWNVNMPSNAFVFNIIQRNSYVPPTK